jgi:putative ABC transport system ATP-binding protein
MTEPIVIVENVHKEYRTGAGPLPVLLGVNLEMQAGEFVSLIGPSGSGKSTLLNLIAGLDKPTLGHVIVGGALISDMNEAEVARWRSAHVGFVFQFYHLLPVLTAYENVELPLLLFDMPSARRRQHVLTALDLVGLTHRLSHRPGQLSGGEQQRVGIARALVTDPTLIVADEPTGDLDGHTSEEILDLLQAAHRDLGKNILLVTHDPRAAVRAQRLVRLEKGQLLEDADTTFEQAFPDWRGESRG